jgi:CheY-like chemotaxis protein
VGQCGVDHQSIAGYLAEHFGAEVERADSARQTLHALRSGRFDLVLVNRVFDRDGSSGLDLIRMLKDDQGREFAGTAIMLVSDYEDAQREAESLGAAPGFGKSALHTAEADERLRSLLQLPPRDA